VDAASQPVVPSDRATVATSVVWSPSIPARARTLPSTAMPGESPRISRRACLNERDPAIAQRARQSRYSTKVAVGSPARATW